MRDELASALKVFTWNTWILKTVGVWPLKTNDLIFVYSIVYVSVQAFFGIAEFLNFSDSKKPFDHAEEIVEIITYSMIHLKLDAYRMNKALLSEIILDMQNDYEPDKYISKNEISEALKYNMMTKLYIKTAFPAAVVTASFWYFRPLIQHDTGLLIYLGNNSEPHALPYRTRFEMAFEIKDITTYTWIYVCQGFLVPIIFVGFIGTDCLLVTMALHVCGQLTVLSHRIQTKLGDSTPSDGSFAALVMRHKHLIRVARAVDSFSNLILLYEFVGTTVLLCLTGYIWLASTEEGQNTNFIILGLYVFTQITMLFGYCFIGECLIFESTNIANAFYKSDWYNLTPKYNKMIGFCMARAQYPMIITAGRFFPFSLQSFTDVMKTSAAYLSVLRSLL